MTVYRNNGEPDPMPATNAQLSTAVQDAPRHPTAQPFPDNDKWLADSVNELRQKDQEYKRLTTEQARGEWEQLARTNLMRSREQAEERESTKALAQAQQQAIDDKHDIGLLKHHVELQAELQRRIPP